MSDDPIKVESDIEIERNANGFRIRIDHINLGVAMLIGGLVGYVLGKYHIIEGLLK